MVSKGNLNVQRQETSEHQYWEAAEEQSLGLYACLLVHHHGKCFGHCMKQDASVDGQLVWSSMALCPYFYTVPKLLIP